MTVRIARIALVLISFLVAAGPARAHEKCHPARVVHDLLDSFKYRNIDLSLQYLDPNVVYINLGLAKVVGKDATRAFLGPLVSLFSGINLVEPSETEIIHQGNVVIAKRNEHYTVSPASPIGNRGTTFDLPVLGRFVVENCLVVSWVDYFSLEIFNAGSGFNLPADLTAIP